MGDMDMKVAGTKKGFTAIQADIKIPGIPLKVVMESLQKATDAKSKIIDIMDTCIASPRKVKKDSWPVTEKLSIEPHQRARIVGPGGMNIKKVYLETGAQLTQNDESSFTLFAPSQAAMDEAKEYIETLLKTDRVPDLEFGGIYTGKIVEIKDIGVLLTLYPNMPPALLHNSQLDQRKVSVLLRRIVEQYLHNIFGVLQVAHPSALGLNVDDEIQVKYFGRDPVSGFMRLSRKVLQGPATQVVKNLDKSTVNV